MAEEPSANHRPAPPGGSTPVITKSFAGEVIFESAFFVFYLLMLPWPKLTLQIPAVSPKWADSIAAFKLKRHARS